ncbi:MAG TPA: hypothetical protein DCO77_04430 [Nitrospiraceae bacterium]|nr:hypothetical protein [Nitrospiraceae bacterium]
MKIRVRAMLLLVVSVLMFSGTAGALDIPERRKPQFETEFGYAVFPYPYSLPGIGSGLGLVGGAMNIDETHTDVYGMIFSGDVRGAALGARDLHIIPRMLLAEIGISSISTVTIQDFGARGMDADKNDYSLIELGDMQYAGGRLTATFYDRRFEIYAAAYAGRSRLESIRDQDGTINTLATDGAVGRGHTTIFGTRVDLTDDYQDPRRGIRLDVSRWHTPPDDIGPDYFIMEYNTTAYVPIGRRSTWALNYFRSDARVERPGVTIFGDIENYLGVTCTTPECIKVINNMIDHNRYGTAGSLGGFNRLRSYPAGRYSGAHALFYGTEVRWNLTDEATPFNIFVMKDIRTAFQIALFYEMGSVEDIRSKLGNVMRASYGLGVRMVTASGAVFRADIAAGREGVEPSIFIGYPWEL